MKTGFIRVLQFKNKVKIYDCLWNFEFLNGNFYFEMVFFIHVYNMCLSYLLVWMGKYCHYYL